jgi:hypothetical protein
MRLRVFALTALLSLSAVSCAQIVVPTFGVRGDVPGALVLRFMNVFRAQLEALTQLKVNPGDLVTPGIAGSLEPGYTTLIAELGSGRYGISGEIAGPGSTLPGEPAALAGPYSVNMLIVDTETKRNSDLISQPLDEHDIQGAAQALARVVRRFIKPSGPLPSGSAGLFISSQPGQAEVLVNGVAVGQTPLEPLQLAPGHYQVEFRKEGFLPQGQMVSLEADKTAFVSAYLTPITGGSIQVSSSPPAEVYLDGREVGATPITVSASPGVRELVIKRPGFMSETSAVPVRNFRVSRVAVTLKPVAGSMVFWQPLTGYLVYIDNLLRPEPFVKDLGVGAHQLELQSTQDTVRFSFTIPSSGVYELDLKGKKLLPWTPQNPSR